MKKPVLFIIAALMAFSLPNGAIAGPFGDVMKDCPKVNGVCVEGSFLKKWAGESNIPIAKAGRHDGGDRGRGSGWGHRPSHSGWGWGRGPRVHHYNGGNNILGSIVGGVIGGGIVSWWNRPEPEVVVVQPPVPEMRLQPWTPDWYNYCGQKYQTFDPKTGYYVGVDGQRYFCQ